MKPYRAQVVDGNATVKKPRPKLSRIDESSKPTWIAKQMLLGVDVCESCHDKSAPVDLSIRISPSNYFLRLTATLTTTE